MLGHRLLKGHSCSLVSLSEEEWPKGRTICRAQWDTHLCTALHDATGLHYCQKPSFPSHGLQATFCCSQDLLWLQSCSWDLCHQSWPRLPPWQHLKEKLHQHLAEWLTVCYWGSSICSLSKNTWVDVISPILGPISVCSSHTWYVAGEKQAPPEADSS